MNRVGMAFRVLWKGNEEAIWKHILTHRNACDQFIKKMEGVAFVVSSITGMLGKTTTGKIVNPGLSYWIVLDSPVVDPRVIVRNVQGGLQGQAEVKLLQEPPIISTVETIQNTLCTAMKDHSNTLIKRRIAQSQPEAYHTPLQDGGFATRLVVQPNDLNNFAKQAQHALQQGGIFVDIVEY